MFTQVGLQGRELIHRCGESDAWTASLAMRRTGSSDDESTLVEDEEMKTCANAFSSTLALVFGHRPNSPTDACSYDSPIIWLFVIRSGEVT